MNRKLWNFMPFFDADGGGGSSGNGSGEGNGSGQNSSNEKSPEGTGEGNKSSGNKDDESDKKTDQKTLSQEEVDKIVNDRLKRERKKFDTEIEKLKKQFTDGGDGEGNANAGADGTSVSKETIAAQAALAAANQRLVTATATTEAVKLGIDPKYVAYAVKLADLSKIKVEDDGSMDTNAVSKAIAAVLESLPVLKATDNSNGGGFKVGGNGNQGNNAGNGWNWGNNSNNQSGTTKRWNKNR
jgi:hypothetical protein